MDLKCFLTKLFSKSFVLSNSHNLLTVLHCRATKCLGQVAKVSYISLLYGYSMILLYNHSLILLYKIEQTKLSLLY